MTSAQTASTNSTGPVGVFDSGLGGLSVLRHIRQTLPHEDLLYVADSSFAPYGGKPEQVIVARSIAIAEFLLERGAKALVVACNTATAAAIKGLRAIYPTLPLVGVEPGLKPAAAISKSGIVGVLATALTVESEKFALLREQLSASTKVRYLPQACVGLVDLIEQGELNSDTTAALIKRYVQPLLEQGADTLVLGCTHYPFVQKQIETCIHETTTRPITIVDTGDAVARQLKRLLEQHGIEHHSAHEGRLQNLTTGDAEAFASAFVNLLNMQAHVTHIDLNHQQGQG